MSGKWVYMALAAFTGVLLSFELHLIPILISSLGMIRVIHRESFKLLTLYITCMLFFYFVSERVKTANVSQYESPAKIQAVALTFKEYPQIDGNRLKAVAITPDKEKFMLLYKIPSENQKNDLMHNLRSGLTCIMDGQLVRPEANRNEHAFNYELYLKRMDIHWIFEPDSITATDCHLNKASPAGVLQNMRASGIQTIENKFPEKLASYAAALIFGERSLISEEADRSYKQLGVVHLLAISGLHVGIIAGSAFFLCIRSGMTRESVFWTLFIFLPGYAVLSGGNPPVIRAVIMAILLLSSKKWRLPLSTLDIFSLSFILFLIFDPLLIYHIGFQLSYAVTFALTLSSGYFFRKNEQALWQMINISVVSMLSSLPVLSYHFYEFSLISIAANLLFVPFYTLILLPAVFILFAISFTGSPIFNMAAAVVDRVVQLSEKIASAAGSLPFSVILTGKPSTLGMIFIVSGILAFFVLKEKRIHPLKCALPLIFILICHSAIQKYSAYGEVVFIDVGQGDSILIKLPYNQGIYMIDTGGQLSFPVAEWQERRKPFKVGRDTLIPFLKSKGISRIDKLILTHSDADHIGAADELIGELEIGEILISPNSWIKPIMADVVNKAFKEKIAVKEVKAGYGWENKSGSFHFIYPFDDEYEGNDDSLVLYASFGRIDWLFTGDLEKGGEEEVLSRYSRLDIDVLKVGHHGSRGSSSEPFIQMIKPEYAIISAGKSNRYGHPHAEVLEILEEENIRIFRTDEHGAIHYRFTSKGGTFKTVLPYDSERNP
ncbi:DNA internalization-related competence protein ComEC/Rec2 [Siminovitchia fortis]|uniref:DNA internalization-related competence protein ComEC/Rec2 n=1 Tax=Siminovitchia fortis TaxID=254758 RepID=A0A443J4E1_9BACI|nr:DNA internalization-related competence protein ComEC/Rec2 [Siminovitchia fortis]RWR15176.1 DNA internalization-related competence protein ComEC/Rec2 [Siminovitchia fortis]WHY82684.1 DNA internalization-related competence protein ComEC/Rec2 [Siminovitchia fortis]